MKNSRQENNKMDVSLLEDILTETVRRIVEGVHPKKIILFGSAVRGKMGPDSDLDLLYAMRYALCAMRYALCCMEMAQDRLEECM
jgi:predicted nucleotidyltransferase